jgi:hypothetical protein
MPSQRGRQSGGDGNPTFQQPPQGSAAQWKECSVCGALVTGTGAERHRNFHQRLNEQARSST